MLFLVRPTQELISSTASYHAQLPFFLLHIFPATCNPPCQNGGQCLSPGHCSCSSGWRGRRCEEGEYGSYGWSLKFICRQKRQPHCKVGNLWLWYITLVIPNSLQCNMAKVAWTCCNVIIQALALHVVCTLEFLAYAMWDFMTKCIKWQIKMKP